MTEAHYEQPSSRIELFDVMVMIIDGCSPQSACSEPAASCTGLGLRGFCIHGQPAQLSALLRPKISDRGSRDGCKRLRIHKNRDPACEPCQQNVQAIFRSMQASCGMAGLSLWGTASVKSSHLVWQTPAAGFKAKFFSDKTANTNKNRKTFLSRCLHMLRIIWNKGVRRSLLKLLRAPNKLIL